jgi:hypothetical protein
MLAPEAVAPDRWRHSFSSYGDGSNLRQTKPTLRAAVKKDRIGAASLVTQSALLLGLSIIPSAGKSGRKQDLQSSAARGRAARKPAHRAGPRSRKQGERSRLGANKAARAHLLIEIARQNNEMERMKDSI